MDHSQGILLEAGTNEFEIVEFSVAGSTYGINVAKVREVINPAPVTPIVKSHPFIDGAFMLRGKVIPLVNLARSLGVESNSVSGKFKIIVCEINNFHVGFRVDDIYRIHRISWTQMEPVLSLSGSELTTGIVKMAEKMVVLLDFERILSDIYPEIKQKMRAVPAVSSEMAEARRHKTILVAEDSKLLRDLLTDTLHAAGYNTLSVQNGQEAWEKLQSLASGGAVEKRVQLVITDIEMPQMDGHHLIKRIKEDDKLKHLPIIIFSSLINESMRRKGETLGACAQVTKPEIGQLIQIVDENIHLSTAAPNCFPATTAAEL